MNRWTAMLGALLFLAVAWALLASRPAPASRTAPTCAAGACPPWTCVDDPSSCGDFCVCDMEEDFCEIPDQGYVR